MLVIKRFHTGVYNIKETLNVLKMMPKEFANKTGIPCRTLSAIINGNEGINFDIAHKLAAYFDNSINFLINLQNQYNFY